MAHARRPLVLPLVLPLVKVLPRLGLRPDSIKTQLDVEKMVRYRSPSSSQSLSAIMDASAQFHFMSPSTTADQESELLSTLRALHTDEFVYLSRNLTGFQKRCEESWVIRSFGICWQYLLFHLQTWVKAMWAFLFFPTSESGRLDTSSS